MLRVLAECKASACKSLQGLDYFAAEGSRAFEDLESFVHKLNKIKSVRRRNDWDKIFRWGASNSRRRCLSIIDTNVYFF